MQNEWFTKGLVFGIIMLFVGAGVVSAFNVNLVKESKSINRGNWLYVGGNESGNYSHIQDAIDNASDGDTVRMRGIKIRRSKNMKRIFVTHCSAKKDDTLKNTNTKVTPDKLYTATPTQRFIKTCKEKGIS